MILLVLVGAFFCPPDQRLRVEPREWGRRAAPEGCAVAGVDVFDSNLTGEGDRLVQGRYRCGEKRSLRIAVLVPLPDGAQCKLDGEDISTELSGGDKRILDFVELTQAGRKVVQVRDLGEGAARVSFFEAQGWSLRKIFETPLLESIATAHGLLAQRWSFIFEGTAFPRSIRTQRCVEGAPCDDPVEFAYSKAGGKYVPK